MATQTANIGLTLPNGSEKVSRTVVNNNYSIIDETFGNVSVLRGSTQYLTSWEVYYTVVNHVCTFICRFTPSQNIQQSVGEINNCGLPNPRSSDFLCMYPVSKVQMSWGLSDTQNRYASVKNIGSGSAQIRACGAFDSGTSYSFAGSYII